tara:strand:+ start:3409 stop:4629 length:1221 start_codon:yes stop_codon:yes gene_type:complete
MRFSQFLTPIYASLISFIIAAFLGLSMRWAFVVDLPEWYQYRNVEHAHSHLALLGWLHAIFLLSIVYFFDLEWKKFAKLYWCLQSAVMGMLFTFPIVGYAPPSIAFTVIHMILSYVFAYKILKELRLSGLQGPHILFVKSSLFFMVLSTLGTWVLGPIMAMGLKGTALYYGSIQFYLHFQFNGWFIFGLLAIFFAIFRKFNINFDKRMISQLFITLMVATILTFALAITWSTPHFIIFIVNSIGVILQLLALYFLYRLIMDKFEAIKSMLSQYAFIAFVIAAFALSIKKIIQAIVVIPSIAQISYTVHNFVIGFIHLLMLGCLSLFAFGSISIIVNQYLSKFGTWIFIFGIVSTELLLFIQGIMFWQGWGFMPHYYLQLAIGSTFIFLGIINVTAELILKKASPSL